MDIESMQFLEQGSGVSIVNVWREWEEKQHTERASSVWPPVGAMYRFSLTWELVETGQYQQWGAINTLSRT